MAAAAAGDGWLGAALAVGAERGVGFFSGVEPGAVSLTLGMAFELTSGIGAALVLESFRNHWTGLAHLPGVTRCQSERLAAVDSSAPLSGPGMPSSVLGA